MKYINSKEAAKKWGMTERRITALCRGGKIEGAKKQGKEWLLPENSSRPVDGRSLRKVSVVTQKPLPIGVSDFKEAVRHYYYVDKTELIRDIIDELPKVSLFTRPRRFGKTLTMDMLRVYFEKTNEDTANYFKDKKIWSYGQKYRDYQNRFPVIYLSFKDVKFASWEDTLMKMKSLFAAEFIRHKEVVGKDAICDKNEAAYFRRVMAGECNEVELTESLGRLSKMLHDYHREAPVIIIDEYDTPIQQGFLCGYYDAVILFMRNLFSGGLKDNPHLSFGFLTGILRVAKESVFSGMNNLIDNSILKQRYSAYFGFTKEEVKTMLYDYGRPAKYAEVCRWYDGYRFGNHEIFNPWSVISYIGAGFEADAYWQNTGNNDIIRNIVKGADEDTRLKLQELLEGKPVLCDIDTSVVYPEIMENPRSVFSFLLIAGYLRINKLAKVGDIPLTYVSIPNKEIGRIYEREILSAIGDSKAMSTAALIQQSIIEHDINAMKRHLESYLKATISFFDASNEGFYHGLMLGLYAALNDLYTITSNRESGDGRFDIAMAPLYRGSPAIVVEVKVLRNGSDDSDSLITQLQDLAKTALGQIEAKGYAKEMESEGAEVLKIGIAFYKKNAEIAYE